MGWLGKMLGSWVSFLMICQQFCTDGEKDVPYRVWGHNWVDCSGTWYLSRYEERVSQKRRRALEMLGVMISNGYFLAREDIVRESSSFCSKLSSATWRLYLRACEKNLLSLHLSEWLQWKCRSSVQLVGFLYSVGESLQSAVMWIFMSMKDICWVEFWKVNFIVRWSWFIKYCRDWNWLVVPRKIKKMSSMNLFQKNIAQIKASETKFSCGGR